MTTISSQQFNRDVSLAKRAALDGPVFITSRGRTTHVLLTAADYESATGQRTSLRRALAAKDTAELPVQNLDLRLSVPDLA
ncbi:MAG: type II toxin-antitoxin system Phd/YefM family antitoxin [Bifidobacteriaceae bacterium]|jgi:prevent-host-death family protein|nr:type II toxin-antitoxin system Phd/YefM family antitoxin [Bifidobacteriaceae bacterium]